MKGCHFLLMGKGISASAQMAAVAADVDVVNYDEEKKFDRNDPTSLFLLTLLQNNFEHVSRYC